METGFKSAGLPLLKEFIKELTTEELLEWQVELTRNIPNKTKPIVKITSQPH